MKQKTKQGEEKFEVRIRNSRSWSPDPRVVDTFDTREEAEKLVEEKDKGPTAAYRYSVKKVHKDEK